MVEQKSVDIHSQMMQEDDNRQERWTQDVVRLMLVVISGAALVITGGVVLGFFEFWGAMPIYLLLALILPVWGCAQRGGWRWVRYFPPLIALGLAAYGSWISGFATPIALFYVAAVVLAAMLRGSRLGFVVAGVSIGAYFFLGAASQGIDIQAFQSLIVFSAAVLGVALLQWYTEKRFRQSLDAQMRINLSHQEEAQRRQQAEHELREQEVQLRRLAENTTDLVTEVDAHGCISYASPSFQSVLGYDPQALIGKNAFDLLDRRDYSAALEAAAVTAGRRVAGRLRSRVRCADERILDVEISATPMYDEAGRHAGFIVAGRDISQRIQAEKAVQASEARFRSIIESLPLGIHLYQLQTDGNLTLIGSNPAADRILGMRHAPLMGLPIEVAFPSLASTPIPQRYRHVAESGEAWQAEHLNYYQEEIGGAFEVHAFRTAPGQMAAMFADIDERLRAAEALRLSEEKFSTAFQTSPDSININRLADGVYLDINQGFTALMGYSREDVLGKSSLELNIWANPADRARLVKGLRERGVVENLEARFRRKNGEVSVGLMSARVIMVQGEKCILSITRDISERIGAELELRETHAKLEQAYEATLVGWARALELRERETADHCQRVVDQTVQMARTLGVQGEALKYIQRGAMLHDIGKVGVPDSILLKPGPLTDDEWVSMRQHVEFAVAMLSGIEYLHASMDIPYCHHEKWDGSGYPRGLQGEAIPLAARIFAVVDVYDALTHDRPYRPAWSAAETRRFLREQSGKHFDPAIVDLFLRMQGTGALFLQGEQDEFTLAEIAG